MIPSLCDGQGCDFSLLYALDCHKGGLDTQCHNEVRDALGDLVALAHRDVIHEPIVQEGGDGVPALIADLGIRGYGSHRLRYCQFDVGVIDADAPSYMSCSVADVLVATEEDKKYLTGAEARCVAIFSPICGNCW